MKFGKQLRATVDNSYTEWRPMFMSYKDLKKCIAPRARHYEDLESRDSDSKDADVDDSDPDTVTAPDKAINEAAVRDAERRHTQFFTCFKKEVDKVNDFFLDKQEDYIIEHAQMSAKVAEYLLPGRATRAEVNRLRQRLTNFHGELVLLENYSTVNYTGFRKILKKHDKKTGLNMHHVYLKTVLVTPFFLSDTVRKLILKTEAQLTELDGIRKFRRMSATSALSLDGPPMSSPNQHAPVISKLASANHRADLIPHSLPGVQVFMTQPRPHAFISPRSALWRLYRDAREYGGLMRQAMDSASATKVLPTPPQALVDLVDSVDGHELGLEDTFLNMVTQPSNYVIAGEDSFSMGFFVFQSGTTLQIFKALRGGTFITKLLRGRARVRCFETRSTQSASTAPSENETSETAVDQSDISLVQTRSGMATGPWPAVTCHSDREHVEYIPETDCAMFYVSTPALTSETVPRYAVHALSPPLFRASCDVDNPQTFTHVSC